MSYRITYDQEMRIYDLSNTRKTGYYMKWIYGAIVCISMIFVLFSGNIRSFLLPGDPKVTEAALIDLAENLREGESFSDAVTVFCREILDHA